MEEVLQAINVEISEERAEDWADIGKDGAMAGDAVTLDMDDCITVSPVRIATVEDMLEDVPTLQAHTVTCHLAMSLPAPRIPECRS